MRSDSLEVYSWSLPGLNSERERQYRYPFAVVPHSFCNKATHTAILDVLVWSMSSLAHGQWPSEGPGGAKYKAPQKGAFGFHAIVAEWSFVVSKNHHHEPPTPQKTKG
eukprot:2776249-Amphidinium_carterae.1